MQMNVFRFLGKRIKKRGIEYEMADDLLGDLSHLVSIFLLLHQMQRARSCAGISFKSQCLYAVVFATRYLDLTWNYVSLYNTFMKLFFIASSFYILYLMRFSFKPTNDPNIDTFKVEYLLGGAAVLSLIFNHQYTVPEILWAFSIWLESVAILPQLLMIQRTGEAENITSHYLFALGAYRGCYVLNWVWRFVGGYWDPIAFVAGIIQVESLKGRDG